MFIYMPSLLIWSAVLQDHLESKLDDACMHIHDNLIIKGLKPKCCNIIVLTVCFGQDEFAIKKNPPAYCP